MVLVAVGVGLVFIITFLLVFAILLVLVVADAVMMVVVFMAGRIVFVVVASFLVASGC